MAEITFTSKKQIGDNSSLWRIAVTALNPIGPMRAVAADEASVPIVSLMNQRPAPPNLIGTYQVRFVDGSGQVPTPKEADVLWRMIAGQMTWEG